MSKSCLGGEFGGEFSAGTLSIFDLRRPLTSKFVPPLSSSSTTVFLADPPAGPSPGQVEIVRALNNNVASTMTWYLNLAQESLEALACLRLNSLVSMLFAYVEYGY